MPNIPKNPQSVQTIQTTSSPTESPQQEAPPAGGKVKPATGNKHLANQPADSLSTIPLKNKKVDFVDSTLQEEQRNTDNRTEQATGKRHNTEQLASDSSAISSKKTKVEPPSSTDGVSITEEPSVTTEENSTQLAHIKAVFQEQGKAAFLEKQGDEYLLPNAVKSGDIESIKFITKHINKEEFNTLTSKSAYSAITWAVANNHDPTILKHFVRTYGADILLTQNVAGNTLLYDAIAGEANDCIDYIMGQLTKEQVTALATQKNEQGESPVLLAAFAENKHALSSLVEKCGSTDILLDYSPSHATPLHLTLEDNASDCISYILEKLNSDQLKRLANQKNKKGESLALLAAKQGHLTALKRLVEACGTDILFDKTPDGSTPLNQALKSEKSDCIDYILAQLSTEQTQTLANSEDEWGHTPIDFAATKGHPAALKILIEACGQDALLHKDSFNNTLLSLVITGQNQDCIDYVLEHLSNDHIRAMATEPNQVGNTPAFLTVKNGQLAVLKKLVETCGTDILTHENNRKSTPLRQAIQFGQEDCVIYILEQLDTSQAKAFALSEDEKYETPASLAVRYCSPAVLRQFAEVCGKDALLNKNTEKSTILHTAARYGKADCVDCILGLLNSDQAGTLATQKNNNGDSPSMLAAWNGHLEALKKMVEIDSSNILMDKTTDGRTLLHLAAQNGKSNCVDYIIDRLDADQRNTKNQHGNTPAHLAALNGHAQVLERLLNSDQAETLATQKNKIGYSPSMLAAWKGHLEALKKLVEIDNSNILMDKTTDGRTLLHLAAQNGKSNCVDYIIDRIDADQRNTKNQHGNTPAHLAALNGHAQALERLLNSDQAETLATQKNKMGYSPSMLAAWNGHLEALKKLVEIGSSNILMDKTADGSVLLHLAAQNGRSNCVDYIIDQLDADQRNTKNQYGDTPAHHAAHNGHLQVLEKLVKTCGDDILLDQNSNEYTPLCFAVSQQKENCVEWLLEQPVVRENLTRIDIFHKSVSSATPSSTLAKIKKEYAEPLVPWQTKKNKKTTQSQHKPTGESHEWPHLLSTSPHPGNDSQPASHSNEWPIFSEKSQQLSQREREAKAVLDHLADAKEVNGVGIYLFNPVYPNETKEQFWSMGDLNGGVQVATLLAGMGAKLLDIILSPPDFSTPEQRSEYSEEQNAVYANKSEVAQHKLAKLLPEFKPDKPLPQTVNLKGCKVTFRDCDDQEAPLPTVMFSFMHAPKQYKETGNLPDSVITIKPYRFASSAQNITTDINNNRGNSSALTIAPNSVIKDQNAQKLSETTGLGETRQESKTSPLNTAVEHLAKSSRAGLIDMSVAYGLHHNKLEESRYNILKHWSDTLQGCSDSTTAKKPVILAVASNNVLKEDLHKLSKEKNIKLIDLAAIKGVEDIQTQIQGLKPGEQAVCILPSLPKAQFNELVLSSQLPTLAEGANLTSFLLENGHPHLSVLPSGKTPIASDMGDPLEAIKAEAFSYKLGMSDEERQLLEQFTALAKENKCVPYGKLLEKIDDIDQKKHPHLAFLCKKASTDTFLKTKELPIRELIEKGYNSSLGETGRQTLLAALDPSPEAFQQYVRAAMDKKSPTTHHFQLQQMHVNQPSLNAVTSSLIQLGRYKGII